MGRVLHVGGGGWFSMCCGVGFKVWGLNKSCCCAACKAGRLLQPLGVCSSRVQLLQQQPTRLAAAAFGGAAIMWTAQKLRSCLRFGTLCCGVQLGASVLFPGSGDRNGSGCGLAGELPV